MSPFLCDQSTAGLLSSFGFACVATDLDAGNGGAGSNSGVQLRALVVPHNARYNQRPTNFFAQLNRWSSIIEVRTKTEAMPCRFLDALVSDAHSLPLTA